MYEMSKRNQPLHEFLCTLHICGMEGGMMLMVHMMELRGYEWWGENGREVVGNCIAYCQTRYVQFTCSSFSHPLVLSMISYYCWLTWRVWRNEKEKEDGVSPLYCDVDLCMCAISVHLWYVWLDLAAGCTYVVLVTHTLMCIFAVVLSELIILV